MMNTQRTLTATALALTLTCNTAQCMLRHALAQAAARNSILRMQIPIATQHIQPIQPKMTGILSKPFASYLGNPDCTHCRKEISPHVNPTTKKSKSEKSKIILANTLIRLSHDCTGAHGEWNYKDWAKAIIILERRHGKQKILESLEQADSQITSIELKGAKHDTISREAYQLLRKNLRYEENHVQQILKESKKAISKDGTANTEYWTRIVSTLKQEHGSDYTYNCVIEAQRRFLGVPRDSYYTKELTTQWNLLKQASESIKKS